MPQNRTADCDLSNTGVLVTRPERQSAPLCKRITDHGGHAIPLPALAIHGPTRPHEAAEAVARLQEFDLVIFISPNAVRYGLQLLAGQRWPQRVQIAAVGHGTALTLKSHNLTPTILPLKRFDSEALLALPELQQMADRSLLIVRGNGGRPLLGDTLQQRGAVVEYAEVYRRECPDIDTSELLKSWPDTVHIVTATSNEILDNLLKLVGKQGSELLRNTPLIVLSQRMQQHAKELGWREIILAKQAGDEAIVAALCEWRSGNPQ